MKKYNLTELRFKFQTPQPQISLSPKNRQFSLVKKTSNLTRDFFSKNKIKTLNTNSSSFGFLLFVKYRIETQNLGRKLQFFYLLDWISIFLETQSNKLLHIEKIPSNFVAKQRINLTPKSNFVSRKNLSGFYTKNSVSPFFSFLNNLRLNRLLSFSRNDYSNERFNWERTSSRFRLNSIIGERSIAKSKPAFNWTLRRIYRKHRFELLLTGTVLPISSRFLNNIIHNSKGRDFIFNEKISILYHLRTIEDKLETLKKGENFDILSAYRDQLLCYIKENTRRYRQASIGDFVRKKIKSKVKHWVLLRRKRIRTRRRLRLWRDSLFLSTKSLNRRKTIRII